MKIRYFDISWLSKVDGPGKRVVVYLQGCNLRCVWCHSPHSWTNYSSLLYFDNRCTGCGKCVEACKNGVHSIVDGKHLINRENCNLCKECIRACPVSYVLSNCGALALPTIETDVDELYNLMKPQLELVKNIGGITISGGEALLQHKSVAQFLRHCQEDGIHTAVETSGSLDRECYESVSGYVDTWLFGLRFSEKDTKNTLKAMEKIESNLQYLTSSHNEIIVRTPIITGYTDSSDSLDKIIRLMKKYKLKYIELLPYNSDAAHYYNALGMEYSVKGCPHPDNKKIKDIKHMFEHYDINTRILASTT